MNHKRSEKGIRIHFLLMPVIHSRVSLLYERHHRRSGAPSRLCQEGKLELAEAPRSTIAVEGIPEGFRLAEAERVAPGDVERERCAGVRTF